MAHGLTILNAKPSVIASSFSMRLIPKIRIFSCGYDSVSVINDDFAVLDITTDRQIFSFYILNGPIATFYDTKLVNVSFSFSLSEVTTLDRKIPPGAEFILTSAGFATVNSSYNTLTQLSIDASDFRVTEKFRFIAAGGKKSYDLFLNSSDTKYATDVIASSLSLTITTDDPSHMPRCKIKVVSG
ncbi:hypothetical protein PENTCL1PPCAC_27593, partial [Pristionchus entomophagus]